MKLQIKKITPETVEIHHDQYGYIGTANEYEFNQLRIDIMNSDEDSEYYVLKNNVRHYINNDGRICKWNFFELHESQLRELLRGTL